VFLRRAATEIPPGASVLDVGAGTAPFRELFAHTNYKTCDWDHSIYDEKVDIRAPATSIPVDDASFDAVVCTQVLEHVPEPGAVLAELLRILRPGGRLLITAPLVWFLHEEPHDYYRYTPHGLRFLLTRAGFADIEIAPMGDSFSTLAELVANLGWMMGADHDPSDQHKAAIAHAMRQLAEVIGSFSEYDARWILPIDYSVKARRPDQMHIPDATPPGPRRGGVRRAMSRLRGRRPRATDEGPGA
jgi:SAM-dependent methyltransferase